MDSTAENTSQEPEVEEILNHPEKTGWFYIFPLFITIFFVFSLLQVNSVKAGSRFGSDFSDELAGKKKQEINFAALLANDQFSKNLRDTVYTDKNLWLELRIDQQMLYVHYRDGNIKKYPVSSGNKFLSKGIESRPGLFAIFHKEEVHLSSQFDNARMNWYMPYNMGIGFHGLPNTGYYGNLGVRPSSHGCIRMRNEDARALFKECDIGTIVLAHRGETVRTVSFAPEGFKNQTEYSKDDYMKIMSYNLGSILEGKYFIDPPKRLIIDGTTIPKSGINVANLNMIPEKQYLPVAVPVMSGVNDYLNVESSVNKPVIRDNGDKILADLEISDNVESEDPYISTVEVDPDKVKKYGYNPIGVLPYFGPKK